MFVNSIKKALFNNIRFKFQMHNDTVFMLLSFFFKFYLLISVQPFKSTSWEFHIFTSTTEIHICFEVVNKITSS